MNFVLFSFPFPFHGVDDEVALRFACFFFFPSSSSLRPSSLKKGELGEQTFLPFLSFLSSGSDDDIVRPASFLSDPPMNPASL